MKALKVMIDFKNIFPIVIVFFDYVIIYMIDFGWTSFPKKQFFETSKLLLSLLESEGK